MNIFAEKNKVLILGRQGENLVTAIKFPVSKWVDEYGSGTFALVHQRKQDAAAYPVTITNDGNNVIWTVGTADVRDAGEGSAQLSYTVNGHIAKSEVFRTNTLRSLDATANPPSAWQAWVDQVLAAGTAATTAVSHYPRINTSNNHWEVWSNNSWTDTGVLAKGSTPVITSSKVDGTTTVKADGATIATLLDGTNGTDGHSPAITASKVNGVTTVSVDGSAVATIEDGTDAEVTHDAVVDAIGYTPVSDVKVAGTSIVTDGVATVPIASATQSGVVKSGYGLSVDGTNGKIFVNGANENNIKSRTDGKMLSAYNVDSIVKSAITAPIGTAGVVDGVYQYPSYTSEEMARARKRINASAEYELIAEFTVEEPIVETSYINRDVNNNSFSLKKLIVISEQSSENLVANSTYSIYYNGSNANKSTLMSAKYKAIAYVSCEEKYNYSIFRSAGPNTYNTAAIYLSDTPNYDTITSFALHVNSSQTLSVGAKFYFYGVRA